MKIHNCEQGTEEWHKLRLGVPTSSNFHKILTPKTMKLSAQADDYIDLLVAEHLTGEPMDEGVGMFMERGTEMEPRARAWYELEYDVEVTEVGLITTDDGRLGCSPDGLVPTGEADKGAPVDGRSYTGGIEIKCPNAKNHVHAMRGGDISDRYKCQIQGQIFVAELEWVDAISFNPAMRSICRRHHRDEEFIAKLKPALDEFCDRLAEAKESVSATASPVA